METNREIIGLTVKTLRTKIRHITQIELCEKLGITQGYLSKLENGIQELGLKDFYNLLDSFNINSLEFEECVKATSSILKRNDLFETPKKITAPVKEKLVKKMNKILDPDAPKMPLKKTRKSTRRVS